MCRQPPRGAQVYDRNLGQLGQWHPSLDWAVADYNFKNWFGIRAGKVKTTMGWCNDLARLRAFAAEHLSHRYGTIPLPRHIRKNLEIGSYYSPYIVHYAEGGHALYQPNGYEPPYIVHYAEGGATLSTSQTDTSLPQNHVCDKVTGATFPLMPDRSCSRMGVARQGDCAD